MKANMDATFEWPKLSRRPVTAQAAPAPVTDPIEAMAEADRADWALMRLVLCAATATMLLALAASLRV